MPIVVAHDRDGRIHAVIVGSPDAPPVAGTTDLDVRVSEVTTPRDFPDRLREVTQEGEEPTNLYLRGLQFQPRECPLAVEPPAIVAQRNFMPHMPRRSGL